MRDRHHSLPHSSHQNADVPVTDTWDYLAARLCSEVVTRPLYQCINASITEKISLLVSRGGIPRGTLPMY